MSFIDFARAHGVEIDYSKLYASERIKRTGTVTKPKSGNGAYFWNGERGWVFDWSGEAKVIWYNDPNAKPWTDDEKRAWAAKRKEQQSEQQKSYDRVAQQADVVLRTAKRETHPYLKIKGFMKEEGLVINEKLLVPMRNVVTNKLQGYQSIYWDAEQRKYEKKMLTGMRAKNAVFVIGDRSASEFWLVEGYATGLSVHLALRSCGMNSAVVVCFSATNLIQVAEQLNGRKFVFADNDESGTGQKAAEATGCPWVMADKVGCDANDLHHDEGIFAVVGKIMGVLTPV